MLSIPTQGLSRSREPTFVGREQNGWLLVVLVVMAFSDGHGG